MATPQTGILASPKYHGSFITLTINDGDGNAGRVREVVRRIDGFVRSIGQKDLSANLECVVAFSDNCWGRLFSKSRPAELKPFEEMEDGPRRFPATAGDVLLHITSQRWDLNFQLASYIVRAFGDSISVIEDTQGIKYLDNRDLIDFVDGTENPQGQDMLDAVLVNDEDAAFAGGSYVTVQRYVHDLAKWNIENTEMQEQIIGRTKHDDVELDDEVKPPWAHNAKSKLPGIEMLRHNMVYGNTVEAGTVFIAYAKSYDVVNESLRQMINADENGDYDRLLDYTMAVTGVTFFAPSQDFLGQIGE